MDGFLGTTVDDAVGSRFQNLVGLVEDVEFTDQIAALKVQILRIEGPSSRRKPKSSSDPSGHQGS